MHAFFSFLLVKKLSKNRALDLVVFHQIRKFDDGISFVEFLMNLDLFRADHNPKFTIYLILLNFTIFELNIYDTRHIGDTNA